MAHLAPAVETPAALATDPLMTEQLMAFCLSKFNPLNIMPGSGSNSNANSKQGQGSEQQAGTGATGGQGQGQGQAQGPGQGQAQGQARTFTIKSLNIMDPLLPSNNLGRSVSRANYLRIRRAFAHGARTLEAIMRKVGAWLLAGAVLPCACRQAHAYMACGAPWPRLCMPYPAAVCTDQSWHGAASRTAGG